jgi:curved DNA-binding protein CbpA
MTDDDHYRVLQVEDTATPEQIKTAFHAAAKRMHPDVNPSPSASEQFQLINRAYEVIGNVDERRIYDNERWNREITGRDLRNPHHDPGSARMGRRTAHIFETIFHPRLLLLGLPIAFCAFMMFGGSKQRVAEDIKVNAWFNPDSKRWETPAPWCDAFTHHAVQQVSREKVHQSKPPSFAKE